MCIDDVWIFVESQFGLGSVVLVAVAEISFGLSLQCCNGCIVCCLGGPVPFWGMMLPLFVCKCLIIISLGALVVVIVCLWLWFGVVDHCFVWTGKKNKNAYKTF